MTPTASSVRVRARRSISIDTRCDSACSRVDLWCSNLRTPIYSHLLPLYLSTTEFVDNEIDYSCKVKDEEDGTELEEKIKFKIQAKNDSLHLKVK